GAELGVIGEASGHVCGEPRAAHHHMGSSSMIASSLRAPGASRRLSGAPRSASPVPGFGIEMLCVFSMMPNPEGATGLRGACAHRLRGLTFGSGLVVGQIRWL